MNRGMTKDGDGRNLPDQQYPKEQAQRACYQPRHRRRSSRKRWGRRPVMNRVRLLVSLLMMLICEKGYFVGRSGDRRRIGAYLGEGALGENTVTSVSAVLQRVYRDVGKAPWAGRQRLRHLHEQTGLTAGTIADDDELATDLGHLVNEVSMKIE